MAKSVDKNGGIDLFEPISPGLALKMIFEKNMGLSMEKVSAWSGIDVLTLRQISDDGRPIDKETGDKLKAAFGDTGTTLVRMQFAFDYFKDHRTLPSLDEIYSI